MAPAVAAKGNRRPDAGAAPVPMSGGEDPEQSKKMLAALAKAQGAFLKNADYVGSRFAAEARAMPLGEQDHRQIYGETSPAEARSLLEDSVPVIPLALPVHPDGSDATLLGLNSVRRFRTTRLAPPDLPSIATRFTKPPARGSSPTRDT